MTGLIKQFTGWLTKDLGFGVGKDIGNDATIGTGGFTQGIPAFWFARAVEGAGTADSLHSPYERSVWVQRAIKKISGPIAGVDVEFSRKTGAANQINKSTKGVRRCYTARGIVLKTQEDFVEVPGVSAWLKRPMKGFTYSDFVEASIGWLKMQECFWLLSDEMLKPFPEAAGGFPPVIVARPDMMRAVIEDGELMGWVWTQPGGTQHSLLPDQVIQLRYWNPYNDFRGLGEYPSASLAAEADYLAGKFARNLMANNGDLGGVIIAKNGVPTNEQREQIIMDLRAKRSAQLRGDLRYTFLTGDIDIKDPKITSVDAPFITQRLENRHEIALAFGVPPSMFDVKASYSIGSASDYYQLLTETCIPTGAKFCDALELLIRKVTGEDLEVSLNWDRHPVMQSVQRELFASIETLASRGMPMATIGEYLGLNLPEFEGDDVGFVPINITPIAEAEAPQEDAYSETGAPKPGQKPNPAKPGDDEGDAPPAVKEMLKMLRGDQKKAVKTKKHMMWEGHMRKRSGTVRAMQSKVNRVINEFRGRTLRNLEQSGTKKAPVNDRTGLQLHAGTCASVHSGPPCEMTTKSLVDLIFSAQHFGAELVSAVNPVIGSALQTAADQVRGEIGVENPWEFPPAKALEFITGRKQAVQGCGETARNELNTALNEGYEAGESMEGLADRVRGVFNNLTKYESKRIAMTETGMAFNFSRHETMVSHGITHKTWLSSHGPNVRDAHAEAEERYGADPIPIDEPFEVDGEELMYPGDPEGSPENVINCQCIQLAVAAPAGGDE